MFSGLYEAHTGNTKNDNVKLPLQTFQSQKLIQRNPPNVFRISSGEHKKIYFLLLRTRLTPNEGSKSK